MTNYVEMPFRLAFRDEGKFINAYFAKSDTMEGADLVASVLKTMVPLEDGSFEIWKSSMEELFTRVIKNATNLDPVLKTRPGPEHEKAGHG